ncbi:MAG: hypothetical protein A4E56_00158 [Pelotomaculum sp. PtaU1.Bin065]|nr:MAG: hypothetical protein A4E56_00158 [Pelotomaculum sp. PtaU1.Bin065]
MITINDIKEYQKRMEIIRKNGFKASEFKALGRELQEKFNLTVPETTAILNNRTDEILEILKNQ